MGEEERIGLLRKRHSVRSFSEEPLPENVIKKLKAEIVMTNSHEQGMRFQLVTNDPTPLEGFSHSYGVFENPRNYMAAVVDVATPDAYERAGYFAERFVMKAVELGVGTCFVSGTYDQKKVNAQVRAGEKILFIVLLGYPAGKSRFVARLVSKISHRKSMTATDFFEPKEKVEESERMFPILRDGLEGMACAPSAMNRRPARIFIGDADGKPALCAKVEKAVPEQLIDLGIAKYNFNYATDTLFEWGDGAPLIE